MVFINHQTYLGGGHIVGNIPAPWFASGITQLEMMCGGDRSSLSGLWASFMPRKKGVPKRRYRKFPDIIDVIRPLSYWNNDGQFMLVLGVPFRNHQIWCNFPQHFQKSPRFQKSPTFSFRNAQHFLSEFPQDFRNQKSPTFLTEVERKRCRRVLCPRSLGHKRNLEGRPRNRSENCFVTGVGLW